MSIHGTLKWKSALLHHPAGSLVGPAAILVGGDVFVHGGFRTRRYPFYKFSLSTKQWTSIEGCAYRYGHSCVLVEDTIYIVGGTSFNRTKLPIEGYDLLLSRTLQYEQTDTTAELAAYVESCRRIVILGVLGGSIFLDAFGFDVDAKRLTKYRVSSGRRPYYSHGASIVECNQKVLFMSRPRRHKLTLFMLTIKPDYSARWEEIRLTGDALPVLQGNVLEVVDGLILCFGGKKARNETSKKAFFIHPRRFEVTQVEDGSAVQQEGVEPSDGFEMGSVSTQNKLWLFGAAHGNKFLEAEFCRG